MKSFKQFMIENPPAWHGTPHEIDKFTTLKMGSGEGNQSYGWGMYFASNKSVAEYYKQALGGFAYNGEPVDIKMVNDIPSNVWDFNKLRGGNADEFTEWANSEEGKNEMAFSIMIDYLISYGDIPSTQLMLKSKADDRSNRSADLFARAFKMFNDAVRNGDLKEVGNLYHVDIIPEDSEFLKWDATMVDQSSIVESILIKSDFNGDDVIASWKSNGAWEHVTGGTLYSRLAGGMTNGASKEGKHKAASLYLHSLGIRGIMYLDGSSRKRGEGNYNYVVFSDDDVKIKENF